MPGFKRSTLTGHRWGGRRGCSCLRGRTTSQWGALLRVDGDGADLAVVGDDGEVWGRVDGAGGVEGGVRTTCVRARRGRANTEHGEGRPGAYTVVCIDALVWVFVLQRTRDCRCGGDGGGGYGSGIGATDRDRAGGLSRCGKGDACNACGGCSLHLCGAPWRWWRDNQIAGATRRQFLIAIVGLPVNVLVLIVAQVHTGHLCDGRVALQGGKFVRTPDISAAIGRHLVSSLPAPVTVVFGNYEEDLARGDCCHGFCISSGEDCRSRSLVHVKIWDVDDGVPITLIESVIEHDTLGIECVAKFGAR